MSWEDVLKNVDDYDLSSQDEEDMREKLELGVTKLMADILNEYDIGASDNSFQMSLVNQGLKKIFEAMMGYVEGSDMTIEGATRESDLKDARSRKEGILLPMAAGRLDIDD